MTISGLGVESIEENYYGLACISCAFFVDFVAESCALKNKVNDVYFLLVECVTNLTAEKSAKNIKVYEIQDSVALEFTTRNVCKPTISQSEHFVHYCLVILYPVNL